MTAQKIEARVHPDLKDYVRKLAGESRLSMSKTIELLLTAARDEGWSVRAGRRERNGREL